MSKLLHIDASPRASRSLTRSLAYKFTQSWLARCPHDEIILRGVGSNPPQFIADGPQLAGYEEYWHFDDFAIASNDGENEGYAQPCGWH